MGKLGNDMENVNATQGQNHFGFSAARIGAHLGATEFTLVTLVVDCSGSISGHQAAIEDAITSIVDACRLSPRADNLMIRLVTFDHKVVEQHGFKPLMNCSNADYKGVVQPGGTTALFDASVNGIESLTTYGKMLTDSEYDVNGIVVVITDGDDNASTYAIPQVKDALARVVAGENLESLVSILIGINAQAHTAYLNKFATNAGFTQYVDAGNADAKTLAKLAQFVSKSITSQSQALGTGGPSQSLTF